MRNIIILNLIGACFVAPSVSAASVIFDLRDVTRTSQIESGLLSVDGVVMSISSPHGDLNQTTGGFGVNHGLAGDVTDEIDGGAGESEIIVFSFAQAGVLDRLTMSSFGASDFFDLKLNGVIVFSLADQRAEDEFSPAIGFTTTDVFSLTHTGGNGASFDRVEISTVPEPSSTTLFGLAGLGAVLRRRR